MVTREKKLIWMTAIISTPIILPEKIPTTTKTAATAEMPMQTVFRMAAME